MKRENRDFIFNGPIVPAIFKLAFPVFIGQIFQFFYNLVDTFWVSNIDLNDPSLVGGTGLIFPIFIIIMAITSGISIGVSSLVSKAIGRKDEERLSKVTESSLFLAVILIVIVIPLGYYFSEEIIGLLAKSNPDYYQRAYEYFTYLLPAFVFFFIQSTFLGVLQGEGDMKQVMKINMIGTLFNFVLDPIFIMGFDMEVRGAALATSLSLFASTCYMIFVVTKKRRLQEIKWKKSNIESGVISEILSVGVLQSFAMLSMSIQVMFSNNLLMIINPKSITAMSIHMRFDQLSMMPAFAFGAATVTLIGQNFGRKKCERVDQIMNKVFLVGSGVILVSCIMVFTFAPMFYSFFSSDPEVLKIATTFTRIAAFNPVLAVFGICGRSFFQALGLAKIAFLITLLRTIILGIPLMYFLHYQFDIGVISVPIGMLMASFISSVVSLITVKYKCRKMLNTQV